MYTNNRLLQLLAITCLIAPINAYAESWTCRHGNDVREIHIERATAEAVPCEVVYKKLTEGVEDQVLWNAQNDDSYCDEKAEGLVSKLETAGWVCSETVHEDTDTQP